MRILAVLAAFLLSGPAFATTVSWDGSTIATDSCSVSGHTKFKSAVPKVVRSEARHAALAAAGAVAVTAPLKQYFLNTTKPLSEYKLPPIANDPNCSWEILVVNDDGTAFIYTHDMATPEPIAAPFAMGSGEDFAMAILVAGGTAEEAVKIAEELDLYTAGQVKILEAPKKAAP
jgi:ATP-dependent protease HslVU (ClpYQ) peptidase subunit